MAERRRGGGEVGDGPCCSSCAPAAPPALPSPPHNAYIATRHNHDRAARTLSRTRAHRLSKKKARAPEKKTTLASLTETPHPRPRPPSPHARTPSRGLQNAALVSRGRSAPEYVGGGREPGGIKRGGDRGGERGPLLPPPPPPTAVARARIALARAPRAAASSLCTARRRRSPLSLSHSLKR